MSNFFFLNILEPSTGHFLNVYVYNGQPFYKATEFGVLMGYRRPLEMIRNFLPVSHLCLRDKLHRPLDSTLVSISKNCRMLTQEEGTELFFKLGRRQHVGSMVWLQVIIEGRVKLSTNNDLSFYFANPIFSCKIPPIFVVDEENGLITFTDFIE
ncbi:hypothetical protein TNCT_247561 [Trichonephila clavata]|uniref:Uncharacterized protein n=1 Tax=Trichonephila clavata TaxID=2740835 RepID=A0A8X6KT60_TRICU|nr:hypothetical protein TNCT_247561 [Trichonephila clavata]